MTNSIVDLHLNVNFLAVMLHFQHVKDSMATYEFMVEILFTEQKHAEHAEMRNRDRRQQESQTTEEQVKLLHLPT
jgi:flavorubredoxin